ncbi:hypothetical protein IAR50_001275 [Cryptococcus sp. DSM 104548]
MSSPPSPTYSYSSSSPPSPSLLTPILTDSPQFPSQKYATTKGFPLLPPSHPLRGQLCSPVDMPLSPASPLCTPKGHPIEAKQFPFTYPQKKPSLAMNPYTHIDPTGRLAHLLRVPRRHRPFILLTLCLLAFGFVLVGRTIPMSTTSSGSGSVFARTLEGEFGKRNVYVQQQAFGEHGMNAQVAQAGKKGKGEKVEPLRFENAEQEFAALISFVTSSTSNTITHSNPSNPLDPALILDFDPSSPRARSDLALVQSEVNTLYPVVLFGKMRDPKHRALKHVLAGVKMSPPPLVVEVDQRRDQGVFIPTLARLLGNDELPQITLQGKPLGSYEQVMEMHEQGKLFEALEGGGVEVRELKKKSRGQKERERLENERILGPGPVRE